jgi:hypothetical protein
MSTHPKPGKSWRDVLLVHQAAGVFPLMKARLARNRGVVGEILNLRILSFMPSILEGNSPHEGNFAVSHHAVSDCKEFLSLATDYQSPQQIEKSPMRDASGLRMFRLPSFNCTTIAGIARMVAV